ncbi:MAG: type III secretion system chaperone [Cyanobacteria bacterium P01_F01_bin.3]
MNRPSLLKILSVASLSLLIGCAYPSLGTNPSESIAQAQTSQQSEAMTLAQLGAILNEEGGNFQGSNGQWQVTVNDRSLIVLADAGSDRMRIFTPVVPAAELSPTQIQSVLLANFHTALDARYALSDNALVAVFVHPLSSLDDDDLRSALSQVSTLANNFGTTYSSGALDFGPGAPATGTEGERISI